MLCLGRGKAMLSIVSMLYKLLLCAAVKVIFGLAECIKDSFRHKTFFWAEMVRFIRVHHSRCLVKTTLDLAVIQDISDTHLLPVGSSPKNRVESSQQRAQLFL